MADRCAAEILLEFDFEKKYDGQTANSIVYRVAAQLIN